MRKALILCLLLTGCPATTEMRSVTGEQTWTPDGYWQLCANMPKHPSCPQPKPKP